MAVKSKNTWILIIFICAGLVIGGLIGKLSAQVDWLSWLAFGQEFGLSQPLVLDLSVLKITFGFTININMASIIGMAIALFIYRWIEKDEKKKEQLLDEILYYNEQDFDIVKEMFFDVNPVTETGVGSCMFPYHEMKRIIHNIRHPEAEDKNVISSGVEAFGWLWL